VARARMRDARGMKRGWLLPIGLVLLSFVPVIAGVLRLTELSTGGEVTPANARFFATPAPVVVHIVGASVYCMLGAFQFVPGIRRHHPRWHRYAGRVLVVCGLAAALSGIWMTLTYPLPSRDGPLLNAFRLVFGTLMTASIVLAFLAIRRHDVARHRAWMIRGYAIGQGAGTQAVLLGLGPIVFGPPGLLTYALLMGAAWVLNLTVAEAAIRRRTVRTPLRIPVEAR
jgi:uncharacterized membrane protein